MPHYRRAKRDGNHPAIVRRLREAGRSVVELHTVGGGCPDLLVGWSGKMALLEVKDPKGRNRIEDSQVDFAQAWKGPAPVVVRSEAEALEATGVRAPAPPQPADASDPDHRDRTNPRPANRKW